MQATLLRLEQRRRDECKISWAELELVSVSQPWLNIIYPLQAVLCLFSKAAFLKLPVPQKPLFGASAPGKGRFFDRDGPIQVIRLNHQIRKMRVNSDIGQIVADTAMVDR
jgi:hypothetical protein